MEHFSFEIIQIVYSIIKSGCSELVNMLLKVSSDFVGVDS